MLVKILGVLAFTKAVMAICPGYNFAIGNVQHVNSNWNLWVVYADNCAPYDSLLLTTQQNPCDGPMFGCSPPPVLFNTYTDYAVIHGATNLIYNCRPDPNSGRCGNDIISVCCRNDGH